MPPSADKRAHIHELFFAYSPPPADSNTDIVVDALDAAIDAIWDWVAARQGQIANALPEPFRSRTNAEQKYLLLSIMAAEQAASYLVIPMPEPEDTP